MQIIFGISEYNPLTPIYLESLEIDPSKHPNYEVNHDGEVIGLELSGMWFRSFVGAKQALTKRVEVDLEMLHENLRDIKSFTLDDVV